MPDQQYPPCLLRAIHEHFAQFFEAGLVEAFFKVDGARADCHRLADLRGRRTGAFSRRTDHVIGYQTLLHQPASQSLGVAFALSLQWSVKIIAADAPVRPGMAQQQQFTWYGGHPFSLALSMKYSG